MITFDQKLVEFLNNWTVGEAEWPVGNLILCAIALTLSVILVGAVGIEREFRGRSAGLRTHLLVGVGSTILMIISVYGFPAIFGGHRDVARLAAQVVTGVGFLGAGAIMHRSSGVKGLTTAGTIWIAMAIGIACGSFNFIIAICGTLLIILVLTLFKKVEKNITRGWPWITLVAPSDEPILGKIIQLSKAYDCQIHGISTSAVEGFDDRVEVTFQAYFSSGDQRLTEFISELEKATKAKSIHLLSHH
ncbi:MAG: MgtC/SapB family protein [Bacilli bacterium]|nr:MgtC/SapB family protein [Bacilli bacterium]